MEEEDLYPDIPIEFVSREIADALISEAEYEKAKDALLSCMCPWTPEIQPTTNPGFLAAEMWNNYLQQKEEHPENAEALLGEVLRDINEVLRTVPFPYPPMEEWDESLE